MCKIRRWHRIWKESNLFQSAYVTVRHWPPLIPIRLENKFLIITVQILGF